MKRLAADDADKMDDGSDESLQKDLTVQDMLLVDRLWQHLLDMGCPPTLLDSSTAPTRPPDLLSPPKPVPVEQDIDMDMDIVVLSVPDVYLGPTPYSKLPPSPALSTRSLPPIPQSAPATPPTSPTESSPSDDSPPSKVYTMSQLVATLIMRHRDRGTVKTRPSPPSPRKPSILAVGPVLRAEDLA
ncbi:hypothetical protein EWM64_g7694 [Hericium alpestre]|uniref:Uncharacterized protein n=1 Tax=Hericium alpestre TaxID=135208 RepID=A0A4Y9ZQI2_9AGAM|nr:hypothetical protein EWM64_g7694 [Hericium alpestre]